VPNDTAATVPTQRDLHLQLIAERSRMAWQKASGYNRRAPVEVNISRYQRAIGDDYDRVRTDGRPPRLPSLSASRTGCWSLDAQNPSAITQETTI
jgi:hypothetical protein